MYIPPTENNAPAPVAPGAPPTPAMPTGQVPNRKTSEGDLDKWNIAMRASPGYQAFLRNIGQGTGPVKLSRGQQEQLEGVLRQAGIPVPSGMHIDQGGNLNQKNTLVRNIGIGVGLTAATLATAGAAGFGPLAGMMSGAGGAAGGAAAVPSLGVTGGIPAGSTIGSIITGSAVGPGIGAGLGGGAASAAGAFGSAFGGPGGASAIGGAAPTVAGGTSAGLTGARTGGSFLSKLTSPDALMAGARGIASIGQSQASNRGTALDAMMEADKMKLAAGQDRRADETHIKNLLEGINYQKTDHPYAAPGTSASGKPFTTFNFGPSDATADTRANNAVLEQQLKQRLSNPPALSDYNSKMNPSKTETAMNWLGPILGFGAAALGYKKPTGTI